MKLEIEIIREGLRKFNRRAGVLKTDPYGIGLTLSQSSALVDLGRFGRLRSSELARLLCLDKSSVSRMVQVLVDKKLVVLIDDPLDRRAKNLELTAGGRKAVDTINEISDGAVADILNHLEPKQRKALAYAMERLGDAAEFA